VICVIRGFAPSYQFMLGVVEGQIKGGKEFKEAVERKRVELLPEIFTTNHTNDTNESGEELE
jgi:hypothetical protein